MSATITYSDVYTYSGDGFRTRLVKAVVTDPTIKTLPTAGVQVLPAPGAGKQHICVKGKWKVDTTAGAYTNMNPVGVSKLRLTYNNLWEACWAIFNDSVSGSTRLTDFMGVAGIHTQPLHFWDDSSQTPATVENQPLMLDMDNSTGNLTGGNAANVLTVEVLVLTL